ncbi:uncharacterized protein V2V93DRAFT_366050 [Kockiozyma suomiensis]|uniref:uncharacterized protein n=1 Tax=Kockiozyma suomiensis TaxID=1337062 RepID=UPI0033443641
MVLAMKQEFDSDLLLLPGFEHQKESDALFHDFGGFPDIVSIPVDDGVSDESSRHSSVYSTPQFATISPDEIFANATPALDSSSIFPSPFESPDESFETSPMFDSHDLGNPDQWPSLFSETKSRSDPSLTSFAKPDIAKDRASRHKSVTSASFAPLRPSCSPEPSDRQERSVSPEGVIVAADGSVVGISERKRKRVTSQSYTRRPRVEPLPPIVVGDAEDSIAVKRARNTLAARRSRERKMLRLTDLEVQVEALVTERDQALKRVLELESEVKRLRGL